MATDTSKSLFDQAMKEISLGNYVAAELALQQASELNEESTTIYAASWAILLALRNREEEAIGILEERLESFSTDPNLLLAYGITLERQGNLVEAEDAFKEALVHDEDNPGALRGLSACLKAKGDLVGATRLAAKAFALVPDNLIFAKTAADLLEATGQRKTAYQVLFLGANYHSDDEELVCRALQACFANDEPDKAGELLTLVDDSQPWAAGWKASFLDWNGDYEKADGVIRKTLERPAGEHPDFLFHAACIAMRRGDPLLADSFVEQILQKDPQHTGALRIRADLSLGRTDYDAAVDPLMKAYAVSSDAVDGWQLFWTCLGSQRFEQAEETLASLGEDEQILEDSLELARLEMAEALLLACQDVAPENTEFETLGELPLEAATGLLLQFLDFLESIEQSNDETEALRAQWNAELGARDPILRLNRLYAQSRWKAMKTAVDELKEAVEDETSPLEPEHSETIITVYSLLAALGGEDTEQVERLTEDLSEELAVTIFHALEQRDSLNPTERRWRDKKEGEQEQMKVLEEDPEVEGDEVQPGGYLDVSEDVEYVYETEDGELITELDEEEYEVVEEDVEIDPNDPDYEYVWVEEEVEEPAASGPPSDSYGGSVPVTQEYEEEIVYVDEDGNPIEGDLEDYEILEEDAE